MVGVSSAERRFWDLVYARPVLRHRQRPNIEPWPGRLQVAALAAAALRANEVVTISIDAPPLDSDRARAVEVPFLGRQARLLPGVVTLAQLTGAPVLMGFAVPRGRLPPPGAGDLRAGADGGRHGGGIRALRRRGRAPPSGGAQPTGPTGRAPPTWSTSG